MNWELFGRADVKENGTVVYSRFHENRNRMRFLSVPEEDIKTLVVTVDESGPYLGWVRTDRTMIELILPVHIFDIQFPYGHKASEEKGLGKAYRVSITEKIEGDNK